MEQIIIYQDNKSTILLANNGRWSSSKRTHHIKSRYFFIKDKVDSKEVSIEHRPTNEMWSDMLTKPKQGKGFRTDRSMLMNCAENYDDDAERMRTHPKLLPMIENDVTINTQNRRQAVDRRSVLGKEQNRPRKSDISHVTSIWDASSNRVGKNNAKARRRYNEVVKARLTNGVEGPGRPLVREVRGRE